MRGTLFHSSPYPSAGERWIPVAGAWHACCYWEKSERQTWLAQPWAAFASGNGEPAAPARLEHPFRRFPHPNP